MTTSGYFAGDSSDLYASFHAAEGDAKAAILIAPPFGDERRACTRFLAQFARRLAAAGCDVLRIDLSATGESPGDLSDAKLPRWAGDIDAAYCELHKLSSAPVQIGLGVRLGANLLLRSSQPDALVLWEPLLDGGKYVDEIVRRKLIKEMKGSGQAANDATSIAAAWAAGDTVDCDGFAISAALACELRSLEMASDLPPKPRDNLIKLLTPNSSVFQRIHRPRLSSLILRPRRLSDRELRAPRRPVVSTALRPLLRLSCHGFRRKTSFFSFRTSLWSRTITSRAKASAAFSTAPVSPLQK